QLNVPLAANEQNEASEPSVDPNYVELDNQITELTAELTDVKQEFESFLHQIRITPSIIPTESNRITSGFGTRIDPFNRSLSHHSGIDIAGAYNAEVYATADGVIKFVGRDQIRGNYVTIDHS